MRHCRLWNRDRSYVRAINILNSFFFIVRPCLHLFDSLLPFPKEMAGPAEKVQTSATGVQKEEKVGARCEVLCSLYVYLRFNLCCFNFSHRLFLPLLHYELKLLRAPRGLEPAAVAS